MTSAFRNFAVIAALVAATSSAPLTAHAFMGDDGAPQAGRHFKKMAAELGLSDQQKQEIKDVFKKDRPRIQPLMKQHLAERRALRSLVQADVIDEAAIRAQSAKVAAVEADLAVQRAKAGQEIRKLLTPEQVQKFKEIQAKRDRKLDEFSSQTGKRLDKDK